MQMLIDDAKAAARKRAFAARREAFAEGQGPAAEVLADFLAPHRDSPLAGYMAMRTEIDPGLAMAAHRAPVGVPVIQGPGLPLMFREWTPGCRMVPGDFGADVPEAGAWVTPRVVIVPLVAFDARGYRLGYGGGFYDRTLALLRAAGPLLAIGFAFAAQELPEVPIDHNDQRLDAIVTDRGVLTFS